jgi:hypothetical protein
MRNNFIYLWSGFLVIYLRDDAIVTNKRRLVVRALRGDVLAFRRGLQIAQQQAQKRPCSSASDVGTESSSSTSTTNKKFRPLPNLKLPRHPSNEEVNRLLAKAEKMLPSIYPENSSSLTTTSTAGGTAIMDQNNNNNFCKNFIQREKVFANSYVDFSKIEMIGFDFDYTLVTYTNDLLSTIYDMALERLVRERQYPTDLQESLTGKFDGNFSIRGLAVDKETGWIAHLSYTHKVCNYFNPAQTKF